MKRPLWRLLWNTKREATFDIGLVIFLTALDKVLKHLFPPDTPPDQYDWIGGIGMSGALTDLCGLALLARRRYPLALLTFVAVLGTIQAVLIEQGPGPLLIVNRMDDAWTTGETPFAIYAVVVYTATRARWLVGWGLIGLLIFLAARPWVETPASVISSAVILTVFPALLGLYVSARRRLVQALRDRAERAEREQHLLAEQARVDERARLALEMHDVVTHRVSLMVLQAGALGITAKDEETRAAAEQLRSSGCEALTELRDFVGVLRRGPDEEEHREEAEVGPLPDLADLIERSEAAGISVEFEEEGSSARVSPAVGRTARRVVQEALTNVYKHAPGAKVWLRTAYTPDRVRLIIRNSGSSVVPAADLALSGSGTGLLGLRQRVDLVGGTLRAGYLGDGGFEVDVVLPAYVPTSEAASE
ncbi:sensor histidine kinase [Saccharopolyspora taberi]|uniref:histidine kinase n=1 Tax=Saccharopolyspora taberi TaxID=60895 RepID=A0ABN3VJT0_9PSEU